MRSGGALARLAEAVAARLFPDAAAPYPIVPIGSLWNAGPPLTDVFARSCARFAPAAVRTPPRNAPAHGAALRALHLALYNGEPGGLTAVYAAHSSSRSAGAVARSSGPILCAGRGRENR